VTDWGSYLACDVCEAKKGGACYTLLAVGPQSLPSQFAEVPHSSRKRSGEKPATRPAKSAGTGQSLPVRRAAKRTASTVSGWEAVIARQQQRRETR
jgi:hypothetical protein